MAGEPGRRAETGQFDAAEQPALRRIAIHGAVGILQSVHDELAARECRGIERGIALGDDSSIDAFVGALPLTEAGTFGGNTSCVQLSGASNEWTVCDAGSGLRAFGDHVLAHHAGPQTYNLFLSHVHWDHIMGFPFFRPAYVGHRGWVGVRLDRKPDWKLVAAVIADGYAFVAASLPRARA